MSDIRRKRSRRAVAISTPDSRARAWLERLLQYGERASGPRHASGVQGRRSSPLAPRRKKSATPLTQ
jgi:hypothetical protein